MVFSPKCLFGYHDWRCVLPGSGMIRYQDKLWWPMGKLFQNCICMRCGRIGKGVILLPAGWEGEVIIINNNSSYGEFVNE